jgi:hypothetical protein
MFPTLSTQEVGKMNELCIRRQLVAEFCHGIKEGTGRDRTHVDQIASGD